MMAGRKSLGKKSKQATQWSKRVTVSVGGQLDQQLNSIRPDVWF